MAEIKQAPAQIGRDGHGSIPWDIHMAAYEVYYECFGSQEALIDLEGRNCRGGFGTGELIAFLYARQFPKTEWDRRVHEVLYAIKTR